MDNRKRRADGLFSARVRVSLYALTVALAGDSALAQQVIAPGTQSASNGQTGLEEIIVTAQRRGQNLQSVPLSVTSFNSEMLAKTGIAKALDLQQIDSSLVMSQQSGAVIPFLRGVGNPASATPGNESSVPIYIDDVYYSRLSPAYLALANVERVEVLKGPQGTLFGRNSSGGLIQILTRDPSMNKTALEATLGYANYDTVSGKLYASTPLGQDAAIDLSVVGSHQGNGWGYNYGNGLPTYRAKFYSFRSKFVADITPTTKIRIEGFYAYENSSQGTVQGGIYPGGTRGLPPGYTQQFIPRGGFYDLDTNTPNFNRHRGYGGSIKIDQDVGFANLVNIASYRRANELFNSEGDQTYVNYLAYSLYIRDRQITEELQIKSKPNSPINWIVGFFYIDSRQGYSPAQIYGDAITASGLSQIRYKGIQTINSYSGYGQATFPVIDEKTNITLGLRYTSDSVLGVGTQRGTLLSGPIISLAPDYRQKVNFDKLTYKVSLDHKFSRGVMGYASVSRGYKSGTFNTLPLDAPPTKPEVVNAYELGIKSELFDRRVRLNVSIFQNDIKDPQVQLIKNVAGVASTEFANAGKARTRGVEFDSTALVARGLTLTVNGQYLDAKFIDFQGAPFNYPVIGPPYGIVATAVAGDASGKRMPQTPHWKINVGATYEIDTGPGNFALNGNMSYRSNFTWDPDNFLTEPSLVLLNASLTYKPAFEPQLSLRAWVNNLTARKYYINELPQNGPVGYMGAVAEPRTFGIEAKYSF